MRTSFAGKDRNMNYKKCDFTPIIGAEVKITD